MKKKLSESEKKVLTFWAILAVVVVGGLLIFKIVAPDKFNRLFGISNSDKKYSLVQDRNRYYTVDNAINKYYLYVNQKDSESVFTILSDNYKKNNNINSKDDIKFNSDVELVFNSGLMCQKKTNTGIYSFYVKGYESNINVSGRLDTKYYEVILDDNNMTFSLQSISEEKFGGECHE